MTIDRETLMAYADGALDPIATKRVERAVAADPELREQVERHRALTAKLRAAYAPTAQPVPDAIAARLRDAAKVVPLAHKQRGLRRERTVWLGAVAASLVTGLLAGPMLFPRDARTGIAFDHGRAIARGEIAQALDTQLASTQAANARVRIGVTFRERDDRLCRTFERGETGGIACAQGRDWEIRRLYDGIAEQDAAYRQASSAAAAMMADAQAMMIGDPLDRSQEAAAIRERQR